MYGRSGAVHQLLAAFKNKDKVKSFFLSPAL